MRHANVTCLALGATLLIGIASALHLISPHIADGDSFLYIREAYRLRTEGFFDISFPWFSHTIIADLGVSLWYGFFVILTPFTYVTNLMIGLKGAGIAFSAGALIVYYVLAHKEKFVWPLVWPLFILGATPNTMFRFLMVRMQLITVPLSIALLYVISRGYAWGALMVTFAIVWIHGNFAWVPFLVYGVAALLAYIKEQKLLWKEGLAVFGGFLLGWFSRPHPFAAAKVFYTQIIEHSLVKRSGLPLLFGAEHFPLTAGTFFRNFLVFAIIEVVAIVFLWWAYKKERERTPISFRTSTFLMGAAVLSVVFFLLTMFFSRRAYDFWVAFGVFAIAGAMTILLRHAFIRSLTKQVAVTLLVLTMSILTIRSAVVTNASINEIGYRQDQKKVVAEWLREQSAPREKVFNIRWSLSQQLFYWNQKNYYVGGFDPIFEYVKDKSIYWKHHYIAEDHEVLTLGKTCGAPECAEDMLEDIYEFIRKEIGARFVLVEQHVNPRAYAYFMSDARFKNVFSTESETLFELRY